MILNYKTAWVGGGWIWDLGKSFIHIWWSITRMNEIIILMDIKSQTISGIFDEKHFGKTDTNPLWIRFNSRDSTDWVGSFASGDIGLINRKVIEMKNTSKVGVLTRMEHFI